MKKFHFITAVLFSTIPALALEGSDIRTVQAEFDLCWQTMERFERSLRRFEDLVNTIKRKRADLPANRQNSSSQDLETLENRLEYLHNRFERSRGQADKIRSDLKNVNGPTCPSCIESGVNMFCRNSETMQNDIDSYLLKAADLHNNLEIVGDSKETTIPTFRQRWLLLDSLQKNLSGCKNPAAETLRLQAASNIARADSFYIRQNTVSATKAIDMAESLLKKALLRCGEK